MVRLTPLGYDFKVCRQRGVVMVMNGLSEETCGHCGHPMKFHPEAVGKRGKCDYISNFIEWCKTGGKATAHKRWCDCGKFRSPLEYVLAEASETKLTEFINNN